MLSLLIPVYCTIIVHCITGVSATVRNYTLDINDISYNLEMMDDTRDELPANPGDSFNIKVSLASDVPSPYITILKKSKGEKQFQAECEDNECEVTAYITSKDCDVFLHILVKTALKGYEMFEVTQPIDYVGEMCSKVISAKCDGACIGGIVGGVCVLIVVVGVLAHRRGRKSNKNGKRETPTGSNYENKKVDHGNDAPSSTSPYSVVAQEIDMAQPVQGPLDQYGKVEKEELKDDGTFMVENKQYEPLNANVQTSP